MKRDDPLVVVHAVRSWLEQTQTWLYNQVSFLAPPVVSHVVCDLTRNLGQFDVPNIHSTAALPGARRFVDKTLRGLRLRRYPGHLVDRCRSTGARVIHSHFGTTGWCNLGALERLGARHVVTFYGFDVNCMPRIDPRWYDRYQRLFRSADRVLCEGPHMAGCVKRLGCPAEKVRVHHLGVDLERIPFTPRSWDGREPLRVLLASSFREKKGLPYALDALALVRRDLEIEVTLIGDATAAPESVAERARIDETIQLHGLGPVVRRLGFQSHERLLEEAERHHVYMAPSVTAADGDTEGGAPVALIEMAASGMAVVASRHCDIPEVIEDGRTGHLAEERDTEGLADRLRSFAAEPSRWEPMVTRARRKIEREFSAAAQGRALAGIYQELAA